MTTPVPGEAPLALWNAVVRFGLEVAALAGLAGGGWAMAPDASASWRGLLAAGLPLGAATVWGTFRVPGDPGAAPVAISGRARLVVEALVFAGGAIGFAVASPWPLPTAFAAAVVLHYAAATDRIRWLLRH